MEKENSNQSMDIICVACPKGCRLQAVRDKEGEILVSNAGCKRGQEYAVSEIIDPRRMVASSVRVKNALHPLLPVYTSAPFPKGRINELLLELRKVELTAPVKMDQVVIDNVLDTGINIIASRDLK